MAIAPGETIAEWKVHVQQATMETYPEKSAKKVEHNDAYASLNGLRPEVLRSRVMFSEPKTLNKAFKKAKKYAGRPATRRAREGEGNSAPDHCPGAGRGGAARRDDAAGGGCAGRGGPGTQGGGGDEQGVHARGRGHGPAGAGTRADAISAEPSVAFNRRTWPLAGFVDLGNITKVDLRVPPTVNARPRRIEDRNMRCHHCHEVGHCWANCPKAGQPAEFRPQPSGGRYQAPAAPPSRSIAAVGGTQCAAGEATTRALCILGQLGEEGREAPVLIDTGATASLVRRRALEAAMPGAYELKPWKGTNLVDVAGRRLEVLGQVDAPLRLGSKRFIFTFGVVERCPAEVLLGVDILDKKLHACINFANATVTILGEELSVENRDAVWDEAQRQVRLVRDTVLAPDSYNTVPVEFDRAGPGWDLAKVKATEEWKEAWRGRGVHLIKGVVMLDRDQPGVIIRNKSNEARRLSRSEVIASATPIGLDAAVNMLAPSMFQKGKEPALELEGVEDDSEEDSDADDFEHGLPAVVNDDEDSNNEGDEHDEDDGDQQLAILAVLGNTLAAEEEQSPEAPVKSNPPSHGIPVPESHFEEVCEGIQKMLEEAHVTPGQRVALMDLLTENAALFTHTLEAPGIANAPQHVIDTGEHAPIRQHPRRVGPVLQEAIDRELQKMLDVGVIRPSQSAWAAPLLVVGRRTER